MKRLFIVLSALSFGLMTNAQTLPDTTKLQEVVVTGTRSVTDIRHLPLTVSVVGRDVLTQNEQPSILPTVMQQVPGLFVTSRGVMGYGVSGGAAGGINMRGISAGSGQFMVLIDGHPQYQGIYFILLGSKTTADGDCSHEIKRGLLLGRKVMTNLDSILKSRDITLPTKVCLIKAMVFPVVMYGCESWTVKKAERRRIDALVTVLPRI